MATAVLGRSAGPVFASRSFSSASRHQGPLKSASFFLRPSLAARHRNNSSQGHSTTRPSAKKSTTPGNDSPEPATFHKLERRTQPFAPLGQPLGFQLEGLAPLSVALWVLSALPALSDELEAAADVPDWFAQSLLTIPLVAYGLFYYVRAKFNPRASLLDYMFLLAVVVVFANLFTSIVFRIRLY